MGWPWGGHGMAVGWPWGGHGVAMGWLWDGHGVAMEPFAAHPGRPPRRFSFKQRAVCFGACACAWGSHGRPHSRDGAGPNELRSFCLTSSELPLERRFGQPPAGPAQTLPAGAGRLLRLRDPPPQPPVPLPRAAAGQGATKPAGRSRPQRQKKKQTQTPTNQTQTDIGESQRGASPAGGTVPVPAGSCAHRRGPVPTGRCQEPLFWGEKPRFDAKRPLCVHAGG